MNDKQIIRLLEVRDEQGVVALSVKYDAYCRSIAQRMTENAEDAAEIVNDVWLRVWESIPPQKPENLRLYLAKLTRNLALDRLRRISADKRGSGTLPLALEELQACIPDNATPESALTAKELGAAINAFLDTQQPRTQDIFLRRYFFAESTAEIAARYRMREANVLLTLSRTRAKLKLFLMQGGYL